MSNSEQDFDAIGQYSGRENDHCMPSVREGLLQWQSLVVRPQNMEWYLMKNITLPLSKFVEAMRSTTENRIATIPVWLDETPPAAGSIVVFH